MIRTCPTCFSAYDVEPPARLPEGLLAYRCTRDHDGGGAHEWVADPRKDHDVVGSVSEGVTDELLEPFLHCVREGEAAVEYGVVEHRFRQQHPAVFAEHVAQAGHRMLEEGRTWTASSVRFAIALSRLARSGELVRTYGPATGAWDYNGTISYWARPGASGTPLTWQAYCAELGRPPTWTDEDRAAARGEVG